MEEREREMEERERERERERDDREAGQSSLHITTSCSIPECSDTTTPAQITWSVLCSCLRRHH